MVVFDKIVFDELDLVYEVYSIHFRNISSKDKRTYQRKRIYSLDIEEFSAFLNDWFNTEANPLMQIISEVTWEDIDYLPIYTRRGARIKNSDSKWTYYNPWIAAYSYENNRVDPLIDTVYWGYPPMLTWLFMNRPKNKYWKDILIHYIKRRYANKKDSALFRKAERREDSRANTRRLKYKRRYWAKRPWSGNHKRTWWKDGSGTQGTL